MPSFFRSRLFWLAAVPLLLVGAYALVGFKVLPGIVRDQAQAFVRENYGRELAIGAVRIHPFRLDVEVRDLAFPDTDGELMLAVERLYADFEIASLWNRAFTFREVDVDGPRIRAVLRPDGSLNLADLALPEEPDQPEEPLPSVWIHHLGVERGELDFVDRARRVPYEHQLLAIGFELEDFRTSPEGGDFSLSARSREEETFAWQGRFALAPVVSSQGEFQVGALRLPGLLEFLGDARPFTSTTGTIDLAGSYRVTLADTLELEATLPRIDVRDLSLLAEGADQPWVRIPNVAVTGVGASLPEQAVRIEKVTVESLTALAWLDADGSINIERVFSAPAGMAGAPAAAAPSTPASTPAPTPVAEPAPAERPWTVAVGAVELTNAAIDFEDRAIAPVTRFRIAPVNLALADASLDLARPLPIRLDAVINDHARFTAQGTLTPEPLAAELDLRLAKARMTILQPYVLPLADLTITGGELDVAGKVSLAPPGGKTPELRFAGEVKVDGFRSVDNARREELVSWSSLALGKVDYAMAPDALSMDSVRVRQPYARVIITPERVLNIAAVLDPKGTAAALAERQAAEVAEAARSPAEKRRLERERKAAQKAAEQQRKADAKAGKAPVAPSPTAIPPDTFPIRIREVRIEAGRMNFTDNFIQPNFSADVQSLDGTITGLSSAWDARAKVDLEGQLGEFSPVTIAGELQPFAFDRFTDLKMRFENISLPIFNPYSGSLAGYNIAKGKLTTDLRYLIEDRRLDAQHRIRIDQLEWGEASATRGEATLPVKFATALLKDREGVINLDVPVGGTLDDPNFRIGPIVWQVIKNILTKAVTAPFALLGSLFEGAEDAQFVHFAAGEAEIDAATAGQLAALAKSLVEKPTLKLDVPIGAVAEIDGPALAERAYRAALDAALAAQVDRKPDAPAPALDSLPPAQQIEVLKSLITTRTGAAPQLPEPPVPPEGSSREEARALREAAAVTWLEQAARTAVTADPAALGQLAEERAAAIERALLADGALEPTRVFKVRDGKVSAEDGRVRFELGLQ